MTRMRRMAGAAVGLGLAGLLALPGAADATPRSLQVQAVVADQVCVNGDTVQVTLSAVTESTSQTQYRWDFTNNGSLDTRRNADPTVLHNYPDEVNVVAKVVARNAEGDKDKDTIAFSTLRCEN
jgi:hypothetical protein